VRKLIRKTFDNFYPPNLCGEKCLLVLMGAERRVKRAQTWERGPPLAQAEIHQLSDDIYKWIVPNTFKGQGAGAVDLLFSYQNDISGKTFIIHN
jgi:hypothetical protein